MEEKKYQAINGKIEPDLLEYITKTFKEWNQLFEDENTLGTREIAKFQWILKGAKLNARYGFEAYATRHLVEEENQDHFTLIIYNNKEEMENGKPLFTFDTPIY